MSKRIAIICQGKAKGFADADGFANISLNQNTNKIASILKERGNWIPEYYTLQDIEDLRKFFKTVKDTHNPSKIIFYYTGHGHLENEIYYIVGETDPKVNLKEALYDLKVYESVSIIVDACQSGYLVRNWNNNYPYIFLTASDTRFAFETKDGGMSYFSRKLEQSIQNGRKFLSEVQIDLEDDYDNLPHDKKQKSRQISLCPEICIANQIDIKIEQPLEDKKLFLTIEIVYHYDDMYYMYTWEEWENPSGEIVLRNTSPSDDSYNKEEIPSSIDEFRRNKYPQIKVSDIFLTLILPSELMTENINFWKLENGQLLGSEYTILLRGRERFVTEGENKNRTHYNIQKWNDNWNEYILKKDNCIDMTSCIITCNDDEPEITSTEVAQTPFALMHYTPTPDSFKNLYKSGFPIIMWANGCKDFSKFEEIFSKSEYKEIKLGNLHNELYRFKPRHAGIERDASIMLIYDNPELLPYDENAPKLKTPQGEINEK